jgi:exopolysaccharide biosynthesis polyprenyl glycosylphosphotransferase
MLYHNVRVMAYYIRCMDALVVSGVSATTWAAGKRLGFWPDFSASRAVALFSITIAIAFMVIGQRMKVYHAWRTEHIFQELAALSEITIYATAFSCLVGRIFETSIPSRIQLAMLIADLSSLLVLRAAMRLFIRRLRRGGRDYRSWLIVGHNPRSARLAEAICANPHFGVRIDQIVDLEPVENTGTQRETLGQEGNGARPRMVKSIAAIREIIASRVIDEVVVTLPVRSFYNEVQQILDICCEAGISVKLPPEAFDRTGYKTEVSQIAGISLVTHFTGPSNHMHLVLKRAIDIVGAAVGILVLSPIFLIIAVAVKLSSPGPVFFKQTRVGLHGRLFQMIKFRSMVRDAAERQHEFERLNQTDGVAFKIKHDPRITRVGRILRKFHLDELPQLFNVFIGDMSLVGPRPLPIQEAHGNEWWQRRRLTMPPGLTCSWQVLGDHKLPFKNWVQLDLAYIDRWSVWLDLKLIASTFATVIRGKGW